MEHIIRSDMEKKGKPTPRITFPMSSHRTQDLTIPRKLTLWEQEIVDKILSQPFRNRDELRQQAASARVAADCLDCASVWLSVDRCSANAAYKEDGKLALGIAPCELEGVDADDMRISVLLHVARGYISAIELFRWDGKLIQVLPEPGAYQLICRP